MIQELTSYGLFMLVINTITLILLFDLARRVSIKLKFVRHPHIYWPSGMKLLAYTLIMLIVNSAEFCMCFYSYLIKDVPVDFWITVFRVFVRTLVLAGTWFHYYYTMKSEFNLFKDKR